MVAIALVGVGKIARDQHLPAIRDEHRFDLVATASPHDAVDGVASFPNLAALLLDGPPIEAVALCTPPAIRHRLATQAIEAGLHVLLEKPPAATLSQVHDLVARAETAGVTLFAAWHSREAAGVAPARAWLANRTITRVRIDWKEDIRRWHPGQEWILGAAGYGVFDPGINALSILTAILPSPPVLDAATLEVPAGRASPIRATLAMRAGAAPIDVEFDFLQTGPQTWTIEVETSDGTLRLADGGASLVLPDGPGTVGDDREYPRLYAHFADLIATGASDVDQMPLRLVADALLVGTRDEGESFSF